MYPGPWPLRLKQLLVVVLLVVVLLVVVSVHVEFVGKSCPVRLFGIHVCVVFLVVVVHTCKPPFGSRLVGGVKYLQA